MSRNLSIRGLPQYIHAGRQLAVWKFELLQKRPVAGTQELHAGGRLSISVRCNEAGGSDCGMAKSGGFWNETPADGAWPAFAI